MACGVYTINFTETGSIIHTRASVDGTKKRESVFVFSLKYKHLSPFVAIVFFLRVNSSSANRTLVVCDMYKTVRAKANSGTAQGYYYAEGFHDFCAVRCLLSPGWTCRTE